MSWPRILVLVLSIAHSVLGQFPPTPENITTLKSRFHSGVKISYKKEPGICESTPGVKSYSGYVHLPPNALDESSENQDYPINLFFWFFESRKDPHNAPLAIWLNGGPGGTSLIGALAENGPCFVGNDSNSTYLNPWSWNNEVNMLYIDQPNQVGYSYDTLTNITSTLDHSTLFARDVEPADFSNGVPKQNLTFLVGTSGSQNVTHTANSSTHAATALWHFAQTWFEEFPHYKPNDEQISLFAESYGGHYGPTSISFFMHQNELIKNGSISTPGAHYLHINTLGLVNACTGTEAQVATWATFPRNNTYGIKAFTESEFHYAMYELTRSGGIQDMIQECRRLRRELDPDDHGDVEKVNEYCSAVTESAKNATLRVYTANGMQSEYDITHPRKDSFPPPYFAGFLNQHWVQKALGVPVNHTAVSNLVANSFVSTGDESRGGSLTNSLAYILNHGVRVAMLYGDRDYICNWVSGESVSLQIPHAHQEEFTAAGYTPLVISPLRSGGLTRQYGNLSFTRVYQAGHMVPVYQPEVAYEIFMRAITGKDIATGMIDLEEFVADEKQYSSVGTPDAWWMKSEVLPSPQKECYIWDLGRCSEEEVGWIFEGTADVKDWIVVGKREDDSGGMLGSNQQVPFGGGS